MIAELALRFALGGAIVSVFSAIGEMIEPKTFAGMFGAAPSIALATLSIAYVRDGATAVAARGEWFALGCVAMFAYCHTCVVLTRRTQISVKLCAAFALGVWLVTVAVFALAGRAITG